MKKSLKVGFGLAATMILMSIASPALAYTPTLSEVRVLSGPDSDDSVDGLAITSDAQTAVVTSSDVAWVVDVSSNVATEISGLPGARLVILDSDENYAYVVSGSLSVSKVNVATASVVETWSDVFANLSTEQLFLSADGETLYAVGNTGPFPNFTPAVVKVDLSSGAMTKYDAASAGSPHRQAAYHAESGAIFIPRIASGETAANFVVFDTVLNAFTDVPWTGPGTLYHCDSQNTVLACVVEDTVPYVATVNASDGSVVTSLDLTSDPYSIEAIKLTPDGTQAHMLFAELSGLGIVEAVDLTDMTSLVTLTTSIEYPERVAIAADAGQIWFYAYYAEDYAGGYQVVQFTEPRGSGEELANTGGSSAIAGALVALSALALAAGVVSRRAARRHGA